MKRLGSCDSLGALMSISPTTDENQFQSMLDGLDEEGCVEESVHVVGEKKRRLGVAQVKALEKNFEVENKLEPERKVKLAQELGLQPRQVAVWFQNRRARWKTKQLERDYGLLKSNYEVLKTNYEALQHDNEALLEEIEKLKSKLNEDNTESNISVKEEAITPDSDDDDKVSDHPQQPQPPSLLTISETKDLPMNYDNDGVLLSGTSLFPDFKDGSSDSDSSAVLNDETTTTKSCLILSPPGGKTTGSSSSNITFKFNVNVNPTTTNNNGFQFSTSSTSSSTTSGYQALQLVKMEEHNFFSGEEACNFFSYEQPPTLQWYCPDQWNYET